MYRKTDTHSSAESLTILTPIDLMAVSILLLFLGSNEVAIACAIHVYSSIRDSWRGAYGSLHSK